MSQTQPANTVATAAYDLGKALAKHGHNMAEVAHEFISGAVAGGLTQELDRGEAYNAAESILHLLITALQSEQDAMPTRYFTDLFPGTVDGLTDH